MSRHHYEKIPIGIPAQLQPWLDQHSKLQCHQVALELLGDVLIAHWRLQSRALFARRCSIGMSPSTNTSVRSASCATRRSDSADALHRLFQHHHLKTRLQQAECGVGADIAGTAGLEDFHSLIYPTYLFYLASPGNSTSPAATLTP